LRDHDRPLNPRGYRDAPVMAERLRTRGCQPDQVLCSTALRARETLSLFQPVLELKDSQISFTEAIYEASPGHLLACVRGADDSTGHLMMFGHNPGFEILCDTLLKGSVDRMATCAVASYSIQIDRWSELAGMSEAENGIRVELDFHDYPKKSPA